MKKGYMLDTNVLIHLAGASNDLRWFAEGLNMGHEYFVTPVQENEWRGMTYRVPGCIVVKQVPDSELRRIGKIIRELHIHTVSSYATWNKGVRLDGAERLMPEGDVPFVKKGSPDELIAEATIYHGLILITNDCSNKKSKRLYQKINGKYPGRALTRDEYMDEIKSATKKLG